MLPREAVAAVPSALAFEFFGVRVCVQTDEPFLRDALVFDFGAFRASAHETAPFLQITVEIVGYTRAMIPPLVESMRSTEFVCYDDGDCRYVDYFGRALVIFDYARETARVLSQDPVFVYEKLYLLILSRVGEAMDRRGLHRLHGLGIAVDGRAGLFLMPSGGGKSTLALQLLQEPRVKLLSEDTPIVDHQGMMHAFPLRLGLSREQLPADAPAHFIREFPRQRYGVKYLLHLDYFRERLESTPQSIAFVFIGKWLNARTPRLQKAGRWEVFLTLVRDGVIGLGLPQVVEFFLTGAHKDLRRKGGIVLKRLQAVVRIAWKAKAYRLLMSDDHQANAKAMLGVFDNAR